MKLIKVAAGVLNQTPLDWQGNRDRVLQALEQARQQQVSLLCLPELCLTGYGCEDAFYATGTHEMAAEMLLEIAPQTKGLVASVGLPVAYSGGVINAACLLVDGRIAGFVGKQHLAGDGIHYEPRWFKPWPAGIHGVLSVGGQAYPIGDLLFDVGGVRIGFEICEDAWVGSRPGARLAQRATDVILNPSASHFSFGKHEIRQRFVLEGSRAFQVAYVYANLVGNEAGRAIYDGDAMIASAGQMLANGARFSFAPVKLTSSVINLDRTRMERAKTGNFRPEIDGDEADVIQVPFTYPDCQPQKQEVVRSTWLSGDWVQEEEFSRAVALGLFDYLRKSRSRGYVVSLSGGCDSTSVVVLIRQMVEFAIAELGIDGLLERLGASWTGDRPADADQVMRQLLTTVYQATANSGPVTREAASQVAEAIGATHYEFDVEPIAEAYRDLVGKATNTDWDWSRHDITLQNIQARVRSPAVWMLANLTGSLLASTSNRSEAAVGYATMDGDTSGGLSPIAGIDKAFLLDWLKWVETHGPTGLGPIPAVHAVNVQQPTAELRPPEQSQTDESDLMPYDVLDHVEQLAIGEKMLPLELWQQLVIEFPEYAPEQLGKWVERFFRLWCRNQWKRERYAPSFHLDDTNLDPKTWCRFPILSGGYELELKRLAESIQRRS